jgi:phosphomannomutase
MRIKFGTDGWRGITAYDFTFSNVLLVTEAIARYLNRCGGEQRRFLIGFDTRFLANEFAHASAHHLAERGLDVAVADAPIPTPAIAYAIKHFGAAGAIQFTASHNPYYYNGLKFLPDFAGPAMPETTDAITANIGALVAEGFAAERDDRAFGATFDIKDEYFVHLDTLVDARRIAQAGMRILYNALWATGAGWLDAFLRGRGVAVDTMNADRDVLFAGSMPDPSEGVLAPMADEVKAGGYDVGLATDGDSDRFAAFDKLGNYLTANQLIPIIAHYLIVHRGLAGDLVRTVVTSSLLDRIAKSQGRRLIETKVGFKYVGDELRRGALCGGEESGGFSMAGHVPEKDGILANLLVCEAVAAMADGDLGRCLEGIFDMYGANITRRNDLHLSEDGKNAVMEQAHALAEHFCERGGELWGISVVDTVTIDGAKFILDDHRSITIRPSGTEPVVRVYMEAPTHELLDDLDGKASRWIETIAGE